MALAFPGAIRHIREVPMRPNIVPRARASIADYPFAVLLAALFLMMALAPSVGYLERLTDWFSGMRALTPLSMIVVAASTLALWKRARHHALNMFLAGMIILVLAVGSSLMHRGWIPIQLATQILFLSYVLHIVVRSVFHARRVTGDILCGSVCVYLLVGVLAGLVFVFIEYLLPGSFKIAEFSGDHRPDIMEYPGWLLYFAFVTLTTVGYGDVLPDAPIARSAATILAVIGQILLMVLIGRLVAINVAQTLPEERPPA